MQIELGHIRCAWGFFDSTRAELERLERLDERAPRGLLCALELVLAARRDVERMRAGPWSSAIAGELAELDRLDIGTLASRAATLRALLARHDEALSRAREEHLIAVQCLAGRLRTAADEVQSSGPGGAETAGRQW